MTSVREETYDFVLFGDSWMWKHYNRAEVLARSEAINLVGYLEPVHPRVVLVKTPPSSSSSSSDLVRRVAITWNSGRDASSTPRIEWRTNTNETSSTNWKQVVATKTETYSREDLCHAPATTYGFRSPGYVHTSILYDVDVNLAMRANAFEAPCFGEKTCRVREFRQNIERRLLIRKPDFALRTYRRRTSHLQLRSKLPSVLWKALKAFK